MNGDQANIGPFTYLTHLLNISSDYVPEKHRSVREALSGKPLSHIKEVLQAQAEAYGKSAVRCALWGYPDAARVWATWAAGSANELAELNAADAEKG